MASGGDTDFKGRRAIRAVPRVTACLIRPVFLKWPGDPPVAWPVYSAMFHDHMVRAGDQEGHHHKELSKGVKLQGLYDVKPCSIIATGVD